LKVRFKLLTYESYWKVLVNGGCMVAATNSGCIPLTLMV
jgi:hypothetical protein